MRKAIMNRFTLVAVGVGVLVGLGSYLYGLKARPVSHAEAVSAGVVDAPKPGECVVAAQPEQPAPRPADTLAVTVANPHPVFPAANPTVEASNLRRTVDLLVSPQATYEQKRAAWNQLRDAGKLDQAIAELEQRTANDPRSAEYPAALGQAYLQKCGTIKDLREQGILAMQADKVFDTALSLDPSNWEALFTKAMAMSYWPPMLNKGEEVIHHFQTLIEQQERQAPQPQFAATYAWLGDQYQKAGRTDDAKTVWQRGATLFPTDEKLRTKLTSVP
jgi:hypothetical protein